MKKFALGIAAVGSSSPLFAQSDIAGVTTAVSGYATAAIAVGITIMLFVIGRGVVRKLAK